MWRRLLGLFRLGSLRGQDRLSTASSTDRVGLQARGRSRVRPRAGLNRLDPEAVTGAGGARSREGALLPLERGSLGLGTGGDTRRLRDSECRSLTSGIYRRARRVRPGHRSGVVA